MPHLFYVSPFIFSSETLFALCYLINKLVNIGMFLPRPPTSRSQASFFLSSGPNLRLHISSEPTNKSYSELWSSILLSISTVALQSILSSLFSSLFDNMRHPLDLDDASSTRALVKRNAGILEGVVGRMAPSREELWEIATGVIMSTGKEWTESHARLFVGWVSGGGTDFNGDIYCPSISS